MRDFTDKQVLFIQTYLATEDGYHSADVAGYANPKQASYELLKHPKYRKVQEEIQLRKENGIDYKSQDDERILDELFDLLEVAKAQVVPLANLHGKQTRDENHKAVFKRDNKIILEVLKAIGNHNKVKAWENKTTIEQEYTEQDSIKRIWEARNRMVDQWEKQNEQESGEGNIIQLENRKA